MKELTDKQSEIRDLLKSGLTYKKCAEHLGLCETSIRLQVKRILKKGFDVSDNNQLDLFNTN